MTMDTKISTEAILTPENEDEEEDSISHVPTKRLTSNKMHFWRLSSSTKRGVSSFVEKIRTPKGVLKALKTNQSSSLSASLSSPRKAVESPTKESYESINQANFADFEHVPREVFEENTECNRENVQLEDDQTDNCSTFFDSLSHQWVQVDNFAFAQESNFFQSKDIEGDQSSIIEAIPSDETLSLLDSELMEDNKIPSISENEEVKTESAIRETVQQDYIPKVIASPRETETLSKRSAMRRLSDELNCPPLPDKSYYPTESTIETELPTEDVERRSTPLFVKKTASSATNAPVTRRKSSKSDTLKASRKLHHPIQHLKLVQRRSKSSTNLANSSLSKCSLNSRSDSSLHKIKDECYPALAGKKKEFGHVKSKVKAYIEDLQKVSSSTHDLVRRVENEKEEEEFVEAQKMNGVQRSASLSNLCKRSSKESVMTKSSALQKRLHALKTLLNDSDEVFLSKVEGGPSIPLASVQSFDKTKISRLLDNLSSSEEEILSTPRNKEDHFEVEAVLALVLEERREKKAAEKILSQLQANYDDLQRKYAEAENKIDKLRFGRVTSESPAESTVLSSSRRTNIFSSLNNTSALLWDSQKPSNKPVLTEAWENILQVEEKLYSLEIDKHKSESQKTSQMDNIREMLKRILLVLRDHIDEGTEEELAAMSSKYQTVSEKFQDLCHAYSPSSSFMNAEITIDPYEKVAQWNNSHDPKEGQTSSEKVSHHHPNNSSCYGSLPTSPSPPGVHCNSSVKENSRPVSPSAEQDSGYPGSDRSSRLFAQKGISPSMSAKSSMTMPRYLFNVEENEESVLNGNVMESRKERNSASSSPIPSDFQPLASSERKDKGNAYGSEENQFLRLPNLHRTYLHTVTDLSSDERSMFDETNQKSSSLRSGKQADSDRSKNEKTSSCLSTGRQPIVLAQQIDQEINELRNFYDDHREGMLSILHGYGSQSSMHLAHDRPDGDKKYFEPRKQLTNTLRSDRNGSPDSSSDQVDLEHERRREFLKRRQSKKKVIKNHVQQQQEHNLDLERRFSEFHIDSTPKFIIGDNVRAVSARGAHDDLSGISSFFPTHLKNKAFEADVEEYSGRQVETDGGCVFVPRLNLDELNKDETRAHDLRSFDFHPSLVRSEPHSSPLEKQAQPAPVHGRDHNDTMPRSQSMMEVATKGEVSTGFNSAKNEYTFSREPVVIVQACCVHSKPHQGVETRPRSSWSGKSPSTLGSRPVSTQSALKTSSSSVKERKKKRDRVKKEMKALLSALDEANRMAVNLRERSKCIVKELSDEIQSEENQLFHSNPGQ